MTATNVELDVLENVHVQFKRYYLWAIVALGLPGNLASLLTFLHMRSLGSCVVYVALLAAVDSVCLLVKLALLLLQQHSYVFTAASCKSLLFVANSLVIYANWIVVALAVERLLAVCRPLVVSVYWTRSKAAAVLAALFLASLIVCLPVLVVTVPTQPDGRSCEYAPEHRGTAMSWHWVNVTLYGFLPCSALLAINVAIIVKLRAARRRHHQLCQENRQREKSNGNSCSSPLTPGGMPSGGGSKGSGGRGNEKSGRESDDGSGKIGSDRGSSERNNARGQSGNANGTVGVRNNQRCSQSQVQASIILLVASCILIVLTTPRCVLHLIPEFWRPSDAVLVAKIRLLDQVTYALSDINHAVNFYLYFVSARHFRSRFLDLLRSTKTKLRQLASLETLHRRVSDTDVRGHPSSPCGPQSVSPRKSEVWQPVSAMELETIEDRRPSISH